MVNDCFIETWWRKNKSWLLFLLVLIAIWLVGIIFIAWFPSSEFNQSLVDKIGGSTSTSDAINLGIAIVTIALAIFAWMAYRYATKQYLINQKEEVIFKGKIDFFLKLSKLLVEIEEKIKEKSKNIYITLEGDNDFEPIDHKIEEQIVINYLMPFLEKLQDEITNILAINLIFPHKQKGEELLEQYMEKLKDDFMDEFVKISKPFSNTLSVEKINELLPTFYNKYFFKTQKEKLFKISEVFLNLDKNY